MEKTSEQTTQEISSYLSWLHPADSNFELRLLSDDGGPRSAICFDKLRAAKMARTASNKETTRAVYVGLNRLIDDVVLNEKGAVSACHVSRYQNLLLDFDTAKAKKIEDPSKDEENSTDEEKKACWKMVVAVERRLRLEFQWPVPAVVDSGNGYHLIYKIDLANNPESVTLVHNVLLALNHAFSDMDAAHIDTKVFDPPRITKLAGTWARKGENRSGRPWRRSAVIKLPESPVVVTEEQLQKVVTLLPEADRQSVRAAAAMHPDFDFDAFCRHYDLHVDHSNEDGTVHFLRECPGWGKPHDKAPARLLTRDTLGFQCHHGSCPAADWSIGDVMRHLHEQGYERYEDAIWAEEKFDDSKWEVDDADDGVEEPEAEPEELLHEVQPRVKGTQKVYDASDPDSPITPVEDAWLKRNVDEDFLASLGNRAKRALLPEDYDKPDADTKVDVIADEGDRQEPEESVADVDDSLRFDERALHGELGRIALELTKSNLSLGWLYPSLLTCASALPGVYHQNPWPENTNLYCALIGGVSGGKSTVMKATKRSLEIPEANLYPGLPVSAPGLMKAIGEQGDPIVFIADEFKSLMKLMRLEGSILGELFCTMFYEKSFKYSSVGKELLCSGEPSLLGGLPIKTEEDFAELFGKESNTGFLDRLIFGYTTEMLEFEGFDTHPRSTRTPCGCVIPKPFYKLTNEWAKGLKCDGLWNRAANIARRIALVQSSFNGEKEISRNSIDHAMAFCEWQLKIRQKFRSSQSEDDKSARCYERLQRKIMKVYQDQKSGLVVFPKAHPTAVCDDPKKAARIIHWPTMAQSCGAYRFGASLVNQIKKAMLDDGSIGKWDPETQKENISGKSSSAWVVVKSLRDV